MNKKDGYNSRCCVGKDDLCMKVGLRCKPPDERDEAENTAVSRSLRWQLDRVLVQHQQRGQG